MSKTTSSDFSKVFEDAEKAVAGIKNDKLKEIAFEKLVSHLLAGNSTDNESEIVIPKTKSVKAKTAKPGTAKPKSKAAKSKESISLDKNLNLREKGKKSFKDFYEEKQPKSAMDFNTVAIYYLSEILELDNITASQVYTCYKEVNNRPPDAFIQSLRDTASVKGYIDSADVENLKIPSRGVNFVDHDLPKKKKDGK
jgi:hypothetical protein